MCLIAIDGTWSHKFNNRFLGKDAAGRRIGVRPTGISNTYRFLLESKYPRGEKFYFCGPELGVSGLDIEDVITAVLNLIEKQDCKEISLVGWSRGAAAASEVAETLHYGKRLVRGRIGKQTNMFKGYRDLKGRPRVRFVGLFDSVSMVMAPGWRRGPDDPDAGYGEEIPSSVKYVAHVVAGDRSGPVQPIPLPFFRAAPRVTSAQQFEEVLPGANHADVGGFSDTPSARQAYQFIREHATRAGVQ